MSGVHPSNQGQDSGENAGHRRHRWVRAPLSALSFWGAIAVPVLYVPLLLGGVSGGTGFGLFLGLFGLHVLALLGGRHHHSGSE